MVRELGSERRDTVPVPICYNAAWHEVGIVSNRKPPCYGEFVLNIAGSVKNY
jgi:hypothetical protein